MSVPCPQHRDKTGTLSCEGRTAPLSKRYTWIGNYGKGQVMGRTAHVRVLVPCQEAKDVLVDRKLCGIKVLGNGRRLRCLEGCTTAGGTDLRGVLKECSGVCALCTARGTCAPRATATGTCGACNCGGCAGHDRA